MFMGAAALFLMKALICGTLKHRKFRIASPASQNHFAKLQNVRAAQTRPFAEYGDLAR
jgi:hypothetical protein